MKTPKIIIITFLIGLITQSNVIIAQDYLQYLDTVFISMETENNNFQNSYLKFNNELLASENFRFNKAIRHAKKENGNLIDSKNESIGLKKAIYLKILRRSANKNETLEGFRKSLSQEIPEIETVLDNETNTNSLYNFTRSNTINGKLEAVSSDLSWL